MKKTYVIGGAAVLTAALLAGCNSNGDDGAVPAAGPTTTTLTITPSLGKINKARVVLRNPKTGAAVGTPETDVIGSGGSIKIKNIPLNQAGPLIVEVQGVDGAQGATYFDESANADVNFPASKKIRAVIPALTPNANIGVTILTELATQAALKKASNDLTKITADIATEANKIIRDNLAKELGANSLLTAPTLIGKDTVVKNSIKLRNAANDYALKLAALAKLGTGASPMLDALEKLAHDISDDKLDGKNGVNPVSFNFNGNADLFAALNAYLAAYANAVQINGIYTNAVLNAFSFTNGGSLVINVNTGGGGGAGSGQACMANIAYTGLPVIGNLTYKVCYNNFPQNAVCGSGNAVLAGMAQSVQVPGAQGGGTVTVNYTFSSVASCATSGANITVNYQ